MSASNQKCPKCGSTEIEVGHHEGDWLYPEFSWYECIECETRFGGDGAYEDVKFPENEKTIDSSPA